MACLAHMLHSPVYCYDASQRYHVWAAYFHVDNLFQEILAKDLFTFILQIVIFK